MKYVKCVYTGLENSSASRRLTLGKIYEVFELRHSVDYYGEYSPVIEIIDNVGDRVSYIMCDSDKVEWFVDATSDIREEKLNIIFG